MNLFRVEPPRVYGFELTSKGRVFDCFRVGRGTLLGAWGGGGVSVHGLPQDYFLSFFSMLSLSLCPTCIEYLLCGFLLPNGVGSQVLGSEAGS